MCGDGSALPLVRSLAQHMGEELEVGICPALSMKSTHEFFKTAPNADLMVSASFTVSLVGVTCQVNKHFFFS